jgi:Zn-dependent protease
MAILAVPMLMAITFHEVCHGYVAWLLGDPTAKRAGRLTLNPIKHLDPLGVLAFVLTQMIGWAKPVPVDQRYFRNPRSGMMLVAMAGPAANFSLAVLSALFIYGLDLIYPGAGPFWRHSVITPLAYMGDASVQVNLALGVFNLLPIPPLDGSNILAGLLPAELSYRYMRLGSMGFIIILILAATGLLGRILLPVVQTLYNILI